MADLAPSPGAMPGGPPPGGINPQMLDRAAAPMAVRPPPAAAGAAGSQGAQLGNLAAAQQKVSIALKALEEALPAIPMGTSFHTKVLKITNDLAREIQNARADPQMQVQQLMQMIKQQQQQQPMAALARMTAQPSPQAPPVMPQPQAA